MTDLTVSVGSTARRRLRSASSADLVVLSTRRSTIGDRAFAVACYLCPLHPAILKHLKSFLPFSIFLSVTTCTLC